MKAILVIDIPDENLWKASNDIYERMKGYKCSLKPMPEKEHPMMMKEGTYFRAYDTGWNDCIDEIIGENNESNTCD